MGVSLKSAGCSDGRLPFPSEIALWSKDGNNIQGVYFTSRWQLFQFAMKLYCSIKRATDAIDCQPEETVHQP